MENKFYVGQRVKDPVHIGETEGIVIKTDEVDCGMQFPIRVSYGGEGTRVYTKDGRYTMYSSPSLIPLDPPRTVLTEWQRKEMREYLFHIKHISTSDEDFASIESILSSPEPPKFVPKEGEAVLYEAGIWMAGVFTNMVKDKYRLASGNSTFCVDRVIPFDCNLHGSNVND